MIPTPLQLFRRCPRLQSSQRCAAKFPSRYDQHFPVKTAIVDVVDQRRHHLIVDRKSMTHDGRQVDIDCVVVPTRGVHRFDASRNTDGHETHSRFDQASCDQRILSPFVAILGDETRIFVRNVKRLAGLVCREDVECRPIKFVDRIHVPALINIPTHVIKLLQECHAVVEPSAVNRKR